MKTRTLIPVLVLLTVWATPVPAGGAVQDPSQSAEAEFKRIAELLQVSEDGVVADVGAGSGSWTWRLADRVGPKGRVFATEVRPRNVDGIRIAARAQDVDHVTAVLGSEIDTGLPTDCCDALLLRLVYHAFDAPQPMRDSLFRAMKARGLVLIIDFRPPVEQLTHEMKDAGFERVLLDSRWMGRTDVYAVLFRKTRR